MIKNPKYRRALAALDKRDDLNDMDAEGDPVNLDGLDDEEDNDVV